MSVGKWLHTVSYEENPTVMEKCQDPAFYVWGYDHHQAVAQVSIRVSDDNTREVRVYCDGEMRIHLWSSAEARTNDEEPEVIRSCDTLREAGIMTDADLTKACDEERLEWINNAWYDLYAFDDNTVHGEHLDCVEFSITDAVNNAITRLMDEEWWSKNSPTTKEN